MLEKINTALQDGDAEQIIKYILIALDEGYEPQEILDQAVLHGMDIIAKKFRNNIIFIPHVLLAARAMAAGMQVLASRLRPDSKYSPGGRVVIGTIEGDLHDLGKNLVKAMLEREGFEVHDLGRDVAVADFINTTRNLKPHIVAISASLTSTMCGIRKVITGLEKGGLRDKVFVMVGGVPITQSFAKDVGADLCPKDVNDAAKIAKEVYFSTTKAGLTLIS